MTEQEVVELMKSSNSADEWNANCDKVKKACAGYPSFWWPAIMQSGVATETAKKLDGSMDIKIIAA